MINIAYFTIGFIIYIVFNIITFDEYSKIKGQTNKFVLLVIFIYYTVLAGYMIYWIEHETVRGYMFEVVYQTMLYALFGGSFLIYYYYNVIKSKNLDFIDIKKNKL